MSFSKSDPEYWEPLNWLVVLLRVREKAMPEDLIAWTIEFHKAQIRELRQRNEGYLKEPKRPRSNEGQPRYAMDYIETRRLPRTSICLDIWRLESESLPRRVIAEHQEINVRSVSDVLEA